jgi:hypothetical protein
MGGALGALGKVLGGLEGVVNDFSATAVATLGGDEPGALGAGLGGAAEGLDAGGPPQPGLGATEPPAVGAVEGSGLEADDMPAPGAAGSGLGADDMPAPCAAALGAREGVAPAGFVTMGGAGIEVRPVAGPGPSGAMACTGIVVEGTGGASSRQASASASKLRKVLRPQIGQSQPTSKCFWCASMLCAGARSRTRSRPTAKPAST